jgi:hypothetical protein
VANENVYYSGSERNENSADGKSLRFHKILGCILESFKAAQMPGAMANSSVQLGTVKKVVNLYVPLQFIIGDVEGGDQLCSRWTYRGIECNRLCRTCDVSTENCGRTDIDCNRIRVADIRHLYNTQNIEALKLLAQRPTYNCFYDIDCGKDIYGIFSMIHTEGLHALEVGVMKYMVEILLTDLPNKQHRVLDKMIKRLNKYPHQHGYNGFPRCTWSDGVTTLTQLTGDQRVGKMFSILLVALTLDGEKFFTKHLKGGKKTWENLCYCYSQVLCYWQWLKQDHYWMAGDDEACKVATDSIKTMMRQIKTMWPREEGLAWLLTKIHEAFHVPFDIHRNGKPANYHTGPQEHNHISIKNAAKKTQMNKHKIDLQTGERIVDRLILQRAYDRVNETVQAMDEDAEDTEQLQEQPGVVKNASKGCIIMEESDIQQDVQQANKRQKRLPNAITVIRWNTTRNGTIEKPVLYQSHVLPYLYAIPFSRTTVQLFRMKTDLPKEL